jgi:nucleoside-diphosphate-sugar epimerase
MTPAPDFAIVGASGFIGSALRRYLEAEGAVCFAPGRNDPALFEKSLGNVIYCAGLTADFRSRPHDTIEAHVSLIDRVLRTAQFDSLTYLSSTRVYIRSGEAREDSHLTVDPLHSEDLFNLSKLAGEAICLHAGRRNVRVVRLSNVLGEDFQSDNFVFSLIRDAAATGRIRLFSTMDSEKDYIHIQDVVTLLAKIARSGRESIYNIAAGQNRTNREIVDSITSSLPAEVTVDSGARRIAFAPICVRRIKAEFDFRPRSILPLVAELAGKAMRVGKEAG